MEKLIVQGGKKLKGEVIVSGAKNVALKALVAACLTDEEVVVENVPLISDFFVMADIIEELGGQVSIKNHRATIRVKNIGKTKISLDKGARIRTSSMFLAPLLARKKEAIIPNPGGCRLGARPIDRTVEGLKKLNVEIAYHSEDGYFHAKTNGLGSAIYTFPKNTHTGTETLILAAVLAQGTTVLKNAAEEPEINDLIELLNRMGAKIKRQAKREVVIEGVKKLHGANFTISPDRNEIVTFAIAALVTKGDIFIKNAHTVDLNAFLQEVGKADGSYEIKKDGIRFFYRSALSATDIITSVYPGFMTDWQAPWAVLMTQACGTSVIHETVFENKLGYVEDLKRMGAAAALFNPKVANAQFFYNFNLEDDSPGYFHAARITGPTMLHNAIITMLNIRAGAAVVLAALAAKGASTIFGVECLDRGYEKFDKRLQSLGADIKRVRE